MRYAEQTQVPVDRSKAEMAAAKGNAGGIDDLCKQKQHNFKGPVPRQNRAQLRSQGIGTVSTLDGHVICAVATQRNKAAIMKSAGRKAKLSAMSAATILTKSQLDCVSTRQGCDDMRNAR
jgi:hypothetical protein